MANYFKPIRVANIEDFTILVKSGAVLSSSKTPMAVPSFRSISESVKGSVYGTKTAS